MSSIAFELDHMQFIWLEIFSASFIASLITSSLDGFKVHFSLTRKVLEGQNDEES